MYDRPIGVAILTNGARLGSLKACISSFLDNCYYRPLVFGVFDNCSTDGTAEYLKELVGKKSYGMEWRAHSAPKDMGCAEGTNRSIGMVNDCEYVVHLESDFAHVPSYLSGDDKLWLHRAVEFMDSGECDYMYLRRMVDENAIFQHWWSQWMFRMDLEKKSYMRCPGFWWSNNPTLFRHEALLMSRTLPLDASMDGAKGTPGWSKPELSAPRPPNAWIHKWGLFVHEMADDMQASKCGVDAKFGCKYGFFRDGTGRFCELCDKSRGYIDMEAHAERYARDAGGQR